jgi:hypothetical protein
MTPSFDEYLGEAASGSKKDILAQVAEILTASDKPLMGLRDDLKALGKVDFSLSPVPHFSIKTKAGKLVVLSKTLVDAGKDTVVVGDVAAGFMG